MISSSSFQLFFITTLLYGLRAAKTNGSDYCRTGQRCWPGDAEISKFKVSLTGQIYSAGITGYKNASYVKNLDYITEPALIVDALNTDDVQKSIRFARKYHIQISVLSSGHDYIGRSTGFQTLMIRMDKMNSTSVPRCGAARSVAMGGWFLGGGHSALSRKFGLGVDQILSFAAVLADGKKVNVSANGLVYEDGTFSSDTDLFWALRGGGGVFAMITQFHFQLHPAPEDGFVTLTTSFPWYDAVHGNVGEQVLDFWNKLLASNLTENWGGYVIVYHKNHSHPITKETIRGSVSFALLHYGGWTEATESIKPLVDFHPEWRKYWLKSVLKDFSSEFYKLGYGVYYNGTDADLVSWKTEYWGDAHYTRLLAIKRKYDPDRFFTGLHCVSSDLPYTGGALSSFSSRFSPLFSLLTLLAAFNLY
ncbi:uncharacterized protein LOC141908557 [Tubulanus polymorphus]|uniref:uncharacterized protein LOC141908557 n=1 Tax=Tubulanus polymorphus TaxID=672921 RepID=UPI003DA2607E